jgi:hypothetical protein
VVFKSSRGVGEKEASESSDVCLFGYVTGRETIVEEGRRERGLRRWKRWELKGPDRPTAGVENRPAGCVKPKGTTAKAQEWRLL